MSEQHFEAAVIGAGVIGASVAHELSRRGLRVIVAERGRGPSGASVACDGFVFLQSKSPGPSLELAKQSRAMYATLAQELDADVEFVSRGGLVLARDDEELAFLDARGRTLAAAGVEVEMLSARDVLALEPHLTAAGASFCASDAQVDPLRLVAALLASARRNRARILTQAPVSGIEPTAKGFDLTCGRESIAAAKIVIAAGAWSAEVGALLGLRIPIRPRRGQLVVTEPAPPILSRPVMTADYLKAKAGDGGPTEGQAAGVSIEQTAAGTLLLGATREFVGFATGTSPVGMGSILTRATEVLPSLRKLSIIRSYAGLRPYCDLGHPIIGPAPDRPGVFIATGHEGDGIALAPVTGKLIADWVLK